MNLIKVGEAPGQLGEILERVSKVVQQRLEQRAKVKSATFYPKIVIGMITVVIVVVISFVIPKFKEFFGKFGGDLPAITRYMLLISDFFLAYWYLIFGGIGAAFFAFKKLTSSPQGRRKYDAYLLKVPIFGSLLLEIELTGFCSILEMLIRSGIPINDGLEILKGSLGNTVLQDEVEKMKDAVESGRSITSGMMNGNVFPKTMTNLIAMGEEAGALEKTLGRIGHYYQMQVDYRLNNLSKAIEPILLVFIFGIVLALALAVFLPMWKMGSLIKK
jgi:type II secretory pathway component PulF